MINNLPIDLLNLLHLNDDKIQEKFFYILNNNFKSDCDGYIYGFTNNKDNNTKNNFYNF